MHVIHHQKGSHFEACKVLFINRAMPVAVAVCCGGIFVGHQMTHFCPGFGSIPATFSAAVYDMTYSSFGVMRNGGAMSRSLQVLSFECTQRLL